MTFDLQIKRKKIEKDANWKAIKHPTFYLNGGEVPNFRLPESNIGFDAAKDFSFYQPNFDDALWKAAKLVSLDKADWNNFVDRPIPQWKDYGFKAYQ